MSVVNPHKKGEHVFNDIAGSLENALASVLAADRVRSIALAAVLDLSECQSFIRLS